MTRDIKILDYLNFYAPAPGKTIDCFTLVLINVRLTIIEHGSNHAVETIV